MKYIVVTLIAVTTLAGCARHRPIVDTKNTDMASYKQDLYECEQYAKQVDNKTAKGALGGAVMGAAIGAVIGNKHTAEKGAAIGAIRGGAKGSRMTRAEKAKVVKNCLRGRGYKVLN